MKLGRNQFSISGIISPSCRLKLKDLRVRSPRGTGMSLYKSKLLTTVIYFRVKFPVVLTLSYMDEILYILFFGGPKRSAASK